MGAMVPNGGSSNGSRRRRRRGRAPMSEINVTPFVDVMLVLLIIFMVSAPLLTPGVDIDLPQASQARTLPRPNTPPVPVTLSADGAIFHGDERVTFDELTQRLRQARETGASDRVYLRAAATLPYEAVAKLIVALTNVGFARIGFITSDIRGSDVFDALSSDAEVVDIENRRGFNAPRAGE